MPWKRAAKDTRARKGNMILVRTAVSAGSDPKAFTMRGVAAMPRATTPQTRMVRTVRLEERNSLVDASSFSWR